MSVLLVLNDRVDELKEKIEDSAEPLPQHVVHSATLWTKMKRHWVLQKGEKKVVQYKM